MQDSLGATLSQVSWVVSSYAIANVIILPMTAWLGERFGKKRYFVFSLVAFTLASMLCGIATNLPMLIFARVLQGLGGGGLLAKAQAILFETFPREEQAMAQGFFGAIVIAGPAIGPTLGGYLVTNIDWRWIFFVNVPVGIAAVILLASPSCREDPERATRAARQPRRLGGHPAARRRPRLAPDGARGGQRRGLVLLEAHHRAVGRRRRRHVGVRPGASSPSKAPVVDLRVLRHRSLWAGSILSTVVGHGPLRRALRRPHLRQLDPPLHLAADGHAAPARGARLRLRHAARAPSSPASSTPRVLLMMGALILVSAMLLLARLTPDTGGGDLFFPLIVRSFGTVLMFLPLNIAALGPIPKKDIAAATGFFSLTRQLGGSDRRRPPHDAARAPRGLPPRRHRREALLERRDDPRPRRRIHPGHAREGLPARRGPAHALALLDGVVDQQAAVLSFGDTFWATAMLVLLTLPLVLLLGRPPKGAAVSLGH